MRHAGFQHEIAQEQMHPGQGRPGALFLAYEGWDGHLVYTDGSGSVENDPFFGEDRGYLPNWLYQYPAMSNLKRASQSRNAAVQHENPRILARKSLHWSTWYEYQYTNANEPDKLV